MSTRKIAKTGKFADARNDIELARMKVEELRCSLFAPGNFELKVNALNCARIELARKEENLKELQKKANRLRDVSRI